MKVPLYLDIPDSITTQSMPDMQIIKQAIKASLQNWLAYGKSQLELCRLKNGNTIHTPTGDVDKEKFIQQTQEEIDKLTAFLEALGD